MPSFTAEPYRGGRAIWPLSPVMKREMQKGIAYNMKIVLRGMRGVGKTCLLARLCGHPLPAEYAPATGIAAGTIRICGTGCQPQEGTKVEVWDVPDVDSRVVREHESCMATQADTLLSPATEAATRAAWKECYASVYAHCRCALLVVDVTQRLSLEYAQKEAQQIPRDTHILVVLNCCDLPLSTHEVHDAEVEEMCKGLRRTASPFMGHLFHGQVPRHLSASVSWLKVSAKTGMGLQELVWALDVPNYFTRIEALETRLRPLYEAVSTSAAGKHHPAHAPVSSSQPPRTSSAYQPLEDSCSAHSSTETRTPRPKETRAASQSHARPAPSSTHAESFYDTESDTPAATPARGVTGPKPNPVEPSRALAPESQWPHDRPSAAESRIAADFFSEDDEEEPLVSSEHSRSSSEVSSTSPSSPLPPEVVTPSPDAIATLAAEMERALLHGELAAP